MAKVLLFGAGASCEYRGVYGPLFVDTTFFPAVREAWETWLREGEPIVAGAWRPGGGRLVPTGPHHYDGERWRWPDLDALLKRVCGAGYEALGLEATFSAVAEREVDAEGDLYLRGLELALFHKLRTTDAVTLDVHVTFLRQHLAPDDVVLTFNYDPLLEIAMGALAPEGIYWHPRDGYRIALLDPDGDQRPQGQPSNVELLKLHGSMNWLAPVDRPPRPPFRLLRVTADNFFRGPGQLIRRGERGVMLRPVIVPPRPDKDYVAMGLTALWTRAEEALANASALTVVGYRLPDTDLSARGLLTRTAGRLAGKPITYVTRGDEDAIRRFRDVFPKADIHRGGFRAYVEAKAQA